MLAGVVIMFFGAMFLTIAVLAVWGVYEICMGRAFVKKGPPAPSTAELLQSKEDARIAENRRKVNMGFGA